MRGIVAGTALAAGIPARLGHFWNGPVELRRATSSGVLSHGPHLPGPPWERAVHRASCLGAIGIPGTYRSETSAIVDDAIVLGERSGVFTYRRHPASQTSRTPRALSGRMCENERTRRCFIIAVVEGTLTFLLSLV